jgi:hypothetical protein
MSEGRRSVRRKLLQKHVGRGKLRSCSAGSPRVCENGRVARTSTSKGVDAASALEGSAPALAARLHQAPAGTRGRGAPAPPGLRGALPPRSASRSCATAAGPGSRSRSSPGTCSWGRGRGCPGPRCAASWGVTSLVRFGVRVAEAPTGVIKGLLNVAEEQSAAPPFLIRVRGCGSSLGTSRPLRSSSIWPRDDERVTVFAELLGRQSRARVGFGEIVIAYWL